MLRAGRLPKAQRSTLVRTFCAPFTAARRAARAAGSGEPMARAPVTAPGHCRYASYLFGPGVPGRQ